MITLDEVEEVEVFEAGLKQPIKKENELTVRSQKQFPADQLSDEWF